MATRVDELNESVAPSVSYASALLNRKSESNKENMESNGNEKKTEEFPQIPVTKPGKSRAERRARHKVPVEKAERKSSQGDEEPEPQVKFVEAPLPKVNPWTKKNSETAPAEVVQPPDKPPQPPLPVGEFSKPPPLKKKKKKCWVFGEN